ncbi:uncharacterized protein LOC126738258 [Anthonomus grandis grandis]|uniref:uncharacterized protein LOC126738258 n=1 Tax=Anthonomus grandis grandis TaxID=2921223 RepID=UPI002166BA2E|nr:uncharacterized protein LOC126738258 [Anthonomus grandis grandis]
MKIYTTLIWIALISCCLSVIALPTSWIYTAPRALFGLAGSASASASAATPKSVIADLRRKDVKAAELQEFNDGMGTSYNEPDEDKESENNEVYPSLFQKKINKILGKLRLIAQIKQAYRYQPEDHNSDTNITLSSQEDNVDAPKSNSTVTIQKDKENIKTNIAPKKADYRSQNIQHVPASAPLNDDQVMQSSNVLELQESPNDEPLKVDLDADKLNDNVEVLITPQTPFLRKEKLRNEPSRLGTLGVFFVELVGSLVGLTYGAVAQITSGGQSPVTISTSEGL